MTAQFFAVAAEFRCYSEEAYYFQCILRFSMSKQTIEQYYEDHKGSGKADSATMMAAMGAIATAGRMWDELPAEKKTAEKAKEIAAASLEPVQGGREADTKDLLFDYAGTRSMVQHYTQDLIMRSEKLDTEQDKEKGTNLKGFLDDVASAVRNVNFDEFKKGNLQGVDLPAIRDKTSEAARTHIGMTRNIDEDIVATIGRDIELKNDPNHQPVFGDVTIAPANLGFGDKFRVGQLMVTYAAALAGSPERAKEKSEEQKIDDGPDPRAEGKLTDEFKVRSMDDIMTFVGGMERLPAEVPMQDSAGIRSNIAANNTQPKQRQEGLGA
jgi:hypothetical protein